MANCYTLFIRFVAPLLVKRLFLRSFMMLTIISGTNRPDSRTLRVAQAYQQIMAAAGANATLLSLEGRSVWEPGDDMAALEKEYLIPAEKFLFVMPEYNGSFPGVLKAMLDNSDIRQCWWGKKTALTGVADGRAGNLRGMEHMTNILHYLKMHVYWDKLPLSRISEEMDDAGHWLKPATEAAVRQQIDGFLAF